VVFVFIFVFSFGFLIWLSHKLYVGFFRIATVYVFVCCFFFTRLVFSYRMLDGKLVLLGWARWGLYMRRDIIRQWASRSFSRSAQKRAVVSCVVSNSSVSAIIILRFTTLSILRRKNFFLRSVGSSTPRLSSSGVVI